MNPPPLPKPAPTSAHHCALCSLIVPLIAILSTAVVHAVSTSLPPASLVITGFISIVLVIVGLVTGILGLSGIRQHGPRGLLGKSIAGVVINGVLVVCFGVAAMAGFQKAMTTQKTLVQNLHADGQEMQANARQSFNEQTGITNTDFKPLDKMESDINSATPTLTGDAASISQALAHYVAKVRSGMQNYHAAAADLRAAQILSTSNLTSVTQLASRHAILQNFTTANDDLKNLISHSEDSLRADLSNANVSPKLIESTLAGFDAKFVPRRDLDLQIRECDDRIGQSMRAVLNLLEADWGRWHFNSLNQKIYFDAATDRQIYADAIKDIRAAGQQQIELQGKLVNLPE